MGRKLSLELTQDTYEDLLALSRQTGFSPEMTAVYAIRLVNACVREGLITDIPVHIWPQEAQLFDTGTGGKVIKFPDLRRQSAKSGQ